MLNFLKEEHIFSVDLTKKKDLLVFDEECDNYFQAVLNKKQVLLLAEELTELAVTMKESS